MSEQAEKLKAILTAAGQTSPARIIQKYTAHNARIRELRLHQQYSQGQGCAYPRGFPV